MSEGYLRHLLSEEIADLEMNGCTADNWENIKVASPFHAEHVCNVHFSGSVALGLFEKEFTLPGGVKKHSGIRNATLHNCKIGDNTLIENVHNYISNYFIGDDCFIQNVNVMYVEGRSSFGNNVEVSVLNETGGREVPIYNGLSASLAYLIALSAGFNTAFAGDDCRFCRTADWQLWFYRQPCENNQYRDCAQYCDCRLCNGRKLYPSR